jgi:hypothetical protein
MYNGAAPTMAAGALDAGDDPDFVDWKWARIERGRPWSWGAHDEARAEV